MFVSRQRVGASEVVATILVIALTLVCGTILFGFVNTQAASSEKQLNNAAVGNVNFLQERFVVAQAVYTSNTVTLEVYDNGQGYTNLAQILIYNNTSSKLDLAYDANYVTDLNHPTCKQAATSSLETPLLGTSSSSFSIPPGGISSIKLTLPSCYVGALKAGFTYYVKLLGEYGNSVTYFQGM